MRHALLIALLLTVGCAEKYPAKFIVDGPSARLRAHEGDSPDVDGSLTWNSAADVGRVSGENGRAMGIDVASPTTPPTTSQSIERLGDFSKGTGFASFYGSTIFGDPGKGEMYALHAGLGYHFLDYQSIGLDLLGAYIDSEIDDDGGALGLDVIYRNHFLRATDDNWTIFFQGGLGLQQQSTNFSGERHFNFRIQLGFGASLKIDDHARAFVGGAYQHISDAGIDAGIDAGGGFDGTMLYVGLMFPL